MKLKTILSTVAMAVTMASCVDGQGIGIKLENMNDSVAPGRTIRSSLSTLVLARSMQWLKPTANR